MYPEHISSYRSTANFFTGREVPYADAVYNSRLQWLLYKIERRCHERGHVSSVEKSRATKLYKAIRRNY